MDTFCKLLSWGKSRTRKKSENEMERNSYVTKIIEEKVFFIVSNDPKIQFPTVNFTFANESLVLFLTKKKRIDNKK